MQQRAATIIPLVPVSRPGSSDLPEGSSFASRVSTPYDGSAFFRRRSASRAGSPLLFGLAPRGVCLAAAITDGAVGSYPTFSPLPACVPFVDIPKVFLRAITGFRSTGGIFSVALSVTRFLQTASPGVTRRVALPRSSRGGVRTFLPPRVVPGFHPAFCASQRSSSSPAFQLYPARAAAAELCLSSAGLRLV